MSVNAIRELTVAELDEVSGGEVAFALGMLAGAGIMLVAGHVGIDLADSGTDFIEAGKQYLEGKQRPS